MPEQDLAGRVAIVTGSGQGLGRAIAWELATHGCNVVVTGRDTCIGDVRDPDTGRRLVALAGERWGRIDTPVNRVVAE